jgi:hypothetical protein
MNLKTCSSAQKAVILLLALLSSVAHAGATTLARMSLQQLARAADTVARVRCVATSAAWDGGNIWTVTDFDVVEAIKGTPPQRVLVRLPGGRVGHISTRVEAVPEFHPGEQAVLFLEATRAGDYAVVAWAEGTFRIRGIPHTDGELVTQDSSAAAVFDPATRQFRAEGIRAVPLNEFRRRLAAALARPNTGESR